MHLVNESPTLSAHKVVMYIHLAGGWLLKVVHAAYQRALSRAARSNYNELLALLDVQVYSFKHFKIAEAFMHIFQTYHLAVLSRCPFAPDYRVCFYAYIILAFLQVVKVKIANPR